MFLHSNPVGESESFFLFVITVGKLSCSLREEVSFTFAWQSAMFAVERCSVNRCVLPSQGHRRKNWKVRKFILRDDPAFMHYYDPTKVNVLT